MIQTCVLRDLKRGQPGRSPGTLAKLGRKNVHTDKFDKLQIVFGAGKILRISPNPGVPGTPAKLGKKLMIKK